MQPLLLPHGRTWDLLSCHEFHPGGDGPNTDYQLLWLPFRKHEEHL